MDFKKIYIQSNRGTESTFLRAPCENALQSESEANMKLLQPQRSQLGFPEVKESLLWNSFFVDSQSVSLMSQRRGMGKESDNLVLKEIECGKSLADCLTLP